VLRDVVGGAWERHSAEVGRALARVPALRGRGTQDDVRAELIAVVAHLTADEGELSVAGLRAALERDQARAAALLACVGSGLRRLPSHRGAVLRGAAGAVPEGLLPGDELFDFVPVTAVEGAEGLAGDRWAVWSVTGRRARSLVGRVGAGYEEIVFAPGTRLRVLEVRHGPAGRTVLLRELGAADSFAEPGALDDTDLAARDRLDDALSLTATRSDTSGWPVRARGGLLRRRR
jgi:hypothetical protein